MTRPFGRRDPSSNQWWMFGILFLLFLAGSLWLFHTGQSLGGTVAAVAAGLDLGASVALFLRARKIRQIARSQDPA